MTKNTKKENELKNCNFKCEVSLWERFKLIAKQNNSDASKVLRNFIQYYVSKNK